MQKQGSSHYEFRRAGFRSNAVHHTNSDPFKEGMVRGKRRIKVIRAYLEESKGEGRGKRGEKKKV